MKRIMMKLGRKLKETMKMRTTEMMISANMTVKTSGRQTFVTEDGVFLRWHYLSQVSHSSPPCSPLTAGTGERGRTEQRSIQYKRRGRGPSATSHGSKTRFLFSAARDEEELSESRAQPRSSPTRSRSPLPAGERGRTAQRGRHQPQRRGRGRTTASRGRGVAAHHRTSPAPHPEWCDTNWQPKNIPFNANPGPASKAAAL
ncbi:uncharacterized protein LOC126399093 isoform X2 [Epinephelus moara]|uniref:uncharacterized protein LOC126399093 isoform X2 n=1 Tax=Epinephelus moara TaxID=300413 RepID=UPI00214E954E|nr:uncharacterized protein LOC126399093 isoform X2 [Epinephelus moara]